ncbi:MAG: alpha/beta fold hydrolase [Planctomycetaceae bacterium]|nr:alpha/beta fold hydrolase [Planctomycetaceae bacterium]
MLSFLLVVLGVFLAAASLLALTLLVYVPPLARGFVQTSWLVAPPSPRLRGGETCRFRARDGIELSGVYLRTPAAQRMGVVVFCHELTSDRNSAGPYVEVLRRRGFDVFAFDFRNHGASANLPGYEPLPWLTRFELADVQGALDYVCSRPDADPRGVGLMGVSRGGTAALAAAAGERRVRAVVTDGAFAFRTIQLHYMRRYMQIYTAWADWFARLPDLWLGPLCVWSQWVIGYRRGCRFVPIESAARRIRQPVLMIHGADDPYIPLDTAARLQTQLGGRSKLWVVPAARHNGSIVTAPSAYHRHVVRFFLKHLAHGRRAPARRSERKTARALA